MTCSGALWANRVFKTDGQNGKQCGIKGIFFFLNFTYLREAQIVTEIQRAGKGEADSPLSR